MLFMPDRLRHQVNQTLRVMREISMQNPFSYRYKELTLMR